MIDLATAYLGLELKNPLVASASPLSEEIDNLRQMEDAGAGALVLHSLFEEQVAMETEELHRYLSEGTQPQSPRRADTGGDVCLMPEIVQRHEMDAAKIPSHIPARVLGFTKVLLSLVLEAHLTLA